MGNESPSDPADVAESTIETRRLSDDTMNSIVDRDRDGSWCVWTLTAAGRRLVSRHATREQAEQSAVLLAARPTRNADAEPG